MRSFWHSSPLTRIVIAMVFGITAGHFAPRIPSIVIFLSIMICFGVLIWRVGGVVQNRRSPIFGLFGALCFLLLGFGFVQMESTTTPVELPHQKMIYRGTVEFAPKKGDKFDQIEIKLSSIQNSRGEHQHINTGCLIYSKEVGDLAPGDVVTFHSSIKPPNQSVNPGQFNYAEYLESKGVFYMGFADSVVVDHLKGDRRFIHFIRQVQMDLVSVFERSLMGDREKEVASALILGFRQSLDKDLKASYADAGVVHILAVSGLHVGIIYLVLQYILLGWMPSRYKKNIGITLVLLFLWGYAAISGFSPSVLRATTMFSFIAIGKSIDRYNSIYNNLAASAIVLLLINPSILFEVGFQLSYAAVVGIALFFKPIHDLWIPKSKWLDKIWSIAVVSFCAQLMTFPLSVFYFHQFPNYFMVSNLCIIPLTGVTIYSGLIALLFSWVPYLGEIIFWIPQGFIWTLNFIVDAFANAPGAVSRGLRFTTPTVILLYLTIFMIYKWVKNPVQWRLYYPIASGTMLLFVWIGTEWSILTTKEVLVLDGPKYPVIFVQNGYKANMYMHPEENRSGLGFYVDGILTERGVYGCDRHFQEEVIIPKLGVLQNFESLALAKYDKVELDSAVFYFTKNSWNTEQHENQWCLENKGVFHSKID